MQQDYLSSRYRNSSCCFPVQSVYHLRPQHDRSFGRNDRSENIADIGHEPRNVCNPLDGDVDDVVRLEHMRAMKDGAVIANSGHFNVEIDLDGLKAAARGPQAVRELVDEWILDGKRLYVLADGRLVNLAAAEGHPASVMDMSFANQALAAEFVVKESKHLSKDVHRIPRDLDQEIARLKLAGMGVAIDTLTAEQRKYLSSWDMGT